MPCVFSGFFFLLVCAFIAHAVQPKEGIIVPDGAAIWFGNNSASVSIYHQSANSSVVALGGNLNISGCVYSSCIKSPSVSDLALRISYLEESLANETVTRLKNDAALSTRVHQLEAVVSVLEHVVVNLTQRLLGKGAVDCGDPDFHGFNESFCPFGTELGSQCTYDCSSEYGLVGTVLLTCGLDGWIADTKCSVYDCDQPTKLPAGAHPVHCPSTTLGSHCNFTCSPSLGFTGNGTLTCTEQGWLTNHNCTKVTSVSYSRVLLERVRLSSVESAASPAVLLSSVWMSVVLSAFVSFLCFLAPSTAF